MLVAAQQQLTRSVGTPAPIRGLMANTPIYGAEGKGANAHEYAIFLYNLVPREVGCTVRLGSREVATGIPDANGADGHVRSVAYFNSQVSQGAGGVDFTFAFTSEGIYDITAGGPGPHTQMLAWPIQGDPAGWVFTVNYTNVAGDHFMLICDEANGYYIFNGLIWVQGSFTGSPQSDPADLVHVIEWQGRIWFVERDTARAWFLDPLALTGTIAPFDVGSRFKKGGHLVANATWTVDDGEGMDDHLVQISSAGDVLVWTGIDPTVAADLTLIGRWFVGKPPEGRRCFSDFGGDLVILSTMGVTRLTALLGGMATINEDSYVTKNISRYISAELQEKIDDFGWQLELNPSDDTIIISVPQTATEQDSRPIQFVANVNTGTWCMYRDLDMLCMDKNDLGFTFGTRDGRVLIHDGHADNRTLDGSSASTIVYSMLSHYSNLGNAASWKRGQFIRPSFIGNGQPVYGVALRYDFDLAEVGATPPFLGLDTSLWDAAVWDQDTWSGAAQSYIALTGLRGMGRHIAIALRGESSVQMGLVGFDLMLDEGGML